jgi:hypothetical protein
VAKPSRVGGGSAPGSSADQLFARAKLEARRHREQTLGMSGPHGMAYGPGSPEDYEGRTPDEKRRIQLADRRGRSEGKAVRRQLDFGDMIRRAREMEWWAREQAAASRTRALSARRQSFRYPRRRRTSCQRPRRRRAAARRASVGARAGPSGDPEGGGEGPPSPGPPHVVSCSALAYPGRRRRR